MKKPEPAEFCDVCGIDRNKGFCPTCRKCSAEMPKKKKGV